MACFEREFPFLIPGFGLQSQVFNGERLTNELFEGAKNIFGPEILQNLLYTLETNFPKDENKNQEEQKAAGCPDGAAASEGGATACKEKVPETRKCEQFPTFVDLLQKVDEFLQQNVIKQTKEASEPSKLTSSAENKSQAKSSTEEESKKQESISIQSTSSQKESSEVARGISDSAPIEAVELSKDFQVDIKTSDFKPEEIKVTVKDGVVTIQAEREDRDDDNGTVLMQKLNKTIKLPVGVDPDKVTCEMADQGLLTIKAPLPKKSEQIRERVLAIRKEKDIV